MRSLAIALCFIWLPGCSPSLQTHTDRDPDHDLWTYSSFDWAQNDSTVVRNPLYYNDLNERRIKEAVMRQLSKRGYQLTNEKPDLLVQYHIAVEDKTVIATEPFGYAYSPYWTRRQQNTYTYTETRINQLVWRSWAVSAVDGVKSPKQIEALVNKAVRNMFATFPKRKPNL
jgi:Domain of unknown function (DUF4136)